MEPAAPGTEDDVPLVPSAFKKKETQQSRLLSIKAHLPNNSYGNVFEHSIINGSEHWYCNLCACPIMGRIYHHEMGKRHTNNMQAAGGCEEPDDSEPEPPLFVAPGEPVPPGFEDNIQKVAQIQERLDNFKVDPLVGLEYLFELTEYDLDKEPAYLCSLCDKRGDPRTVISHLASYNHISQYLQRHFLKCYRALSPYITKQYKHNWQMTMQKIAEAIETKYGRLTPHVVEKAIFEKKRPAYQNMVVQGPHFNERAGATFEELVIKEDLTRVITDEKETPPIEVSDTLKRNFCQGVTEASVTEQKRSPSPPVVAKPKKPRAPPGGGSERRNSLSSVSSISSSELSDFEPGPIKTKEVMSRSPRQNEPANKRQRFFNEHDDRWDPRKRNNRRRPNSPSVRSVPPWQRPDYRSRDEHIPKDRPKTKQDKQEEYKKLSGALEKDIERTYKQHEKNPEKHPAYNDEWKKFWNHRYKELQAEGKNPAGHDFKPEWIEFWNKRLKELQASEVKTKKDALRKRLGLIDEPAPICFRITGKKKPTQKDEPDSKLAPMASAPDQDPDVIIIDDKDTSHDRSVKPPKRRRSRSPWEPETTRNHERPKTREWPNAYREPTYYRKEYIKPPRVMRDVTRHPVGSPPPPVATVELPVEDTGEINVVSVLRLLTALEERLGSLGPKVNDLLSQALAMEKTEANSSEKLLDNDVNCVMFETVKEKLKGQLLAGLVNFVQEKAFKTTIKRIASLIHVAGERKKEHEKNKPKVDPIQVPGIGKIDKGAIAKQIAAALIGQGKTDVSQQELEQLINAVVGMAEASKASNKPITTAAFLQQLSAQKQTPAITKPATESTTASFSTNSMEGLSDSDLQTLLQNFKDLCTDEQHNLIAYLKLLEAREPDRVERLRQFVNLDQVANESESHEKSDEEGRTSPFAGRFAKTNPALDDHLRNRFEVKNSENKVAVVVDSDDDYTFEDVFQAANKNVRDKEEKEEQERLQLAESAPIFKDEDFDVNNAKSLIANIMGQFRSKNAESTASQPSDLTGVGTSPFPSNVLDNIPINIANITSALNTVHQNRLPANPAEPLQPSRPPFNNNQPRFEPPQQFPRFEPPVPSRNDHPPHQFEPSSGGFRFEPPPSALRRNLPQFDQYHQRSGGNPPFGGGGGNWQNPAPFNNRQNQFGAGRREEFYDDYEAYIDRW